MKTSHGLTLALGVALAGGMVRADRIVVTQDREGALYAAGEQAKFSVSVVDDAGVPLKDGSARWTLDNFGTEKVANGQAALAEGNPFSVTGTLAKSGFLRLRVRSGTNSVAWSVGYDVDRIRQDGTRPSDFDCYWRGEQQRLRREVPLDPTCEKVETQSRGRWDVFRISFRTFNGKRVWGFMSVPKDRTQAPFRTRVRICDAGPGAIGPWEANADEVTVTMNVYCFEPGTTGEEQTRRREAMNAEQKAKYGTDRYSTSGIGESREDYYFHDAMLGIDRAVDWLAERPEVDRTRMYYFGSSQGGGFGLYVNYLNGNFAKACFAVPACTGHYGHLQGRQDGWPNLIAAQPEAKRAAAEKFAAYFDGVHFAAGIHRPVRFIVGFSDQTCPPPDVYAAFNACASADKAIVNCVGAGHCEFNAWIKANKGKPSWLDHNAWLRDETKRLKVLMVGNSFSQSCMRYLPSVAKACGVELDLVSACIGGCPLVKHWNNITNAEDRSYGLSWTRDGEKAPWPALSALRKPRPSGKGRGANLVDVLKAERWDIVTIQQYSGDSWQPETYRPYFADLYKKFKTCAPQAEVVVQETWSYAASHGALRRWKIDNVRMYHDLHRAYYDIAAAHGLRVIPVGTAVQLWRDRLPVVPKEGDYGGDVVGQGRDPQHLNPHGDYLQALVWTAKLFGVDVTKCPFAPNDLAPEKAALMRRAAADAVNGVRVPVSAGGFAVPDEIAAKIETLRTAHVNRGEIVELDYASDRNCLRVAYVLRHSPVSYVRCELALPDPAKWDGRLWGFGNGGWAGGVSTPWSSSTAQVTTDLGTSRLTIGANPCDIEVLRDFGWRATHEMTVEAKKLIALYYGRGPDHSYFTGASTGGGQGFCEMQRYPEDYDGIIAAVPGNDRLARATGLWQVMQARKVAKPFTDAERKTIRRAELDYFAKTDPEIARGRFIWDPTPTKEKLDGCWQAVVAADPNLKDREAAWRSLFDDAVVRGRRLEPGALIGLELDPPWTFMLEKYVGSIPWGGVTEEQLLFFADEPNLRHVDDDLKAFAKRGGKVISFGGLEDMSVPERPVAEYFDAVARRFGGVGKAQEFFAYYRIPGRQHCHSTPYPHGFVGEPRNLREKIVAWVEKGERPAAIVVPFVDEPAKTLTLRPYPDANRE